MTELKQQIEATKKKLEEAQTNYAHAIAANRLREVPKYRGLVRKYTKEIRNLVGQGAGAMLGRSIWGQAKKEFSKVQDDKIKKEMVKDFVDFYGKNIIINFSIKN